MLVHGECSRVPCAHAVAELGLKVKEEGGSFKGGLFIVFENCFLFSKTKKTCLVSSFFFLKNTMNTKNNKFKEQVQFVLFVFKNCSQE